MQAAAWMPKSLQPVVGNCLLATSFTSRSTVGGGFSDDDAGVWCKRSWSTS